MEFARDMRIRNDLRGILGDPLLGAGRRLGQLPLVLEQVLEEVVAPQRRGLGPGHLDTAGDGVLAVTTAEVAHPAQALGLDRSSFRLRPLVRLRRGTVGLAESVATGDQGNDLLVVHGHAVEGGADVLGRLQVVTAGIRPFRVHIDQAHVGSAEGTVQLAAVLDPLRVDTQPLHLGAPVDVLVRFPGVLTTTGKAEGTEAHGLQRDVAGEDEQVRPGNLLAVLLLDRPQEAARLVDVDVVRPGVERRETLLATTAAATAIGGAVGTGGVPGHADELRTIVAEVGGPPVLRIGHQLHKVGLERLVVELLEGFGVVELLAERVGLFRMLVEQIYAKLVRPPVPVRGAATGNVVERTFTWVRHCSLLSSSGRSLQLRPTMGED